MINYYDKIMGGNFGDDLNEFLWPKLFPKPLESYFDEDTLFIGIGTRLRPHKIPDGKKKIIFGAGYGYASEPPKIDSTWYIKCVRGPLTAKALGIDKKLAVTDSAILARDLIRPLPQTNKLAFIPHHLTLSEDNWSNICNELGIMFINPKEDPVEVIQQISSCKLLITESLHGAIMADTYRVPWIPVATRKSFSHFKWNDWALSLKVPLKVHDISPLYDMQVRSTTDFFKSSLKRIYGKTISKKIAKVQMLKLINKATPVLSKEEIFNRVYNRLSECFQELLWDIQKNCISFK
jgi:succinoglycan biosynthesis protein ExoV